MAVESSQIPEKTVEQIFDERYPLDKLKAQDYTSAIRILPKAMAKCRSPHWKRRSELHFACR